MSRQALRIAKLLCAAILLALVPARPSAAAEIEHTRLDDGAHLIVLIGDIVPGDEEKFRRLSVQYDNAIVALASDGGALVPAIEIGKMIRLKEFPTVVLNNDRCNSACALIWVAGSKRYLAPRGRVGFHASYRDEGGRRVETGLGNALVGRYLTLLNLPEKAVLFATSASPDEVSWLTTGNMAIAGIQFEVFGDEPAAPPPLVRTPVSPPVAAAAPGTTQDSEWRYVSENSSGSHYYVRTKDWIKGRSHHRAARAWVKTDDRSNSGVEWNESKELIEFNCPAGTYRSISTTLYFEDGRTESLGASSPKYVVPESVFEAVFDAVCTDPAP